MPVDARLLEILVCPESKAPLAYFEDFENEEFLFCPESGLKYPVRDGIPVMLVDDAQRLDVPTRARLTEEAQARHLLPG